MAAKDCTQTRMQPLRNRLVIQQRLYPICLRCTCLRNDAATLIAKLVPAARMCSPLWPKLLSRQVPLLYRSFAPTTFIVYSLWSTCFCVGGPDFAGLESRRSLQGKPRLALHEYVNMIPRRVETQYRRDWPYTHGVWNLLFKSLVNSSRSLSFRYPVNTNSCADMEPEAVGKAACSIYEKLWHGQYTTNTGKN